MTKEEYIRKAIEMLDNELFEGDLDLINHQYQVSWGRCPGKKLTETIQPYEDENARLEDFFPTTICINFTIKDPIEFLGNLALECIHAFFNEKKSTTKRFKSLAKKYYFDSPYNSYHPTQYLEDILNEIFKKLEKECGKWPITPVIFPVKEKKEGKKNTIVLFCPNCGLEAKVSKKAWEKSSSGFPTCGCGAKWGQVLDEEINENENEQK